MAESYISELGDSLSHGVANTNGDRVKIIAPKLYNDGNGNHPSIATALAGKSSTSHTHTTSIASDSSSGTVVTLAHNTQYKLTAGGTSVLFKTPADSNTDTKVTQTVDTSASSFPILAKNTTATSTITDTSRFADGVTVTPSTKTINASYINAISDKAYTSYTTGTGKVTGDTRWMWVCRLKGIVYNSYNTVSLLFNNEFWNTQQANVFILNFAYGRNGGQGTTVSVSCNCVGLMQKNTDIEFKFLRNPSDTAADNTIDVYIRVSASGNSYGGWYAKVLNSDSQRISSIIEWKWQFNQTLPDGAEDIPVGGSVNYAATASTASTASAAQAGSALEAAINSKVAKAGDTMTGRLTNTTEEAESIRVSHGKANTNASMSMTRTDTGTQMFVGIGAGGINHGVYSNANSNWMLKADTSGVVTINDGKASNKVAIGNSNLGSTTKPIYLAAGVPTEGSSYAGGTAVTLNGTSAAASTASFYAPTGAGTSNYVLKSNGSGAPTWVEKAPKASAADTATKPLSTLLTSSDDLNNVKADSHGDVRTYHWSSGNVPANSVNTTSTGMMQVFRTHSNQYCVQMAYICDIGLYKRVLVNGTWGAWSKILAQADVTDTYSSTGTAPVNGKAVASAISGKSPTSHTHTVKINGSEKTIAATGGTTVDLGNYPDYVYFGNDSPIGSHSPADQCKTYFTSTAPSGKIRTGYNYNGDEYTLIFSKQAGGNYGSIIKYGYASRYIYILRYRNSAWQTDDWEKIAAGYADSAGSASKVANKLTLKIKTGTTEGTDLYTYDGSGAKTLDIKQGSNITLTAAAGSLTIAGTADTKNTAGSTDTSSKIFLIGATSQAANPQTYSQDTTYVDTDATLASTKVRVAEKCTLQFNTTTNALDFVFA